MLLVRLASCPAEPYCDRRAILKDLTWLRLYVRVTGASSEDKLMRCCPAPAVKRGNLFCSYTKIVTLSSPVSYFCPILNLCSLLAGARQEPSLVKYAASPVLWFCELRDQVCEVTGTGHLHHITSASSLPASLLFSLNPYQIQDILKRWKW